MVKSESKRCTSNRFMKFGSRGYVLLVEGVIQDLIVRPPSNETLGILSLGSLNVGILRFVG